MDGVMMSTELQEDSSTGGSAPTSNGVSSSSSSRSPSSSNNRKHFMRKTSSLIRRDGIGSEADTVVKDRDRAPASFHSLQYAQDESDVYRSHLALDHYHHRGTYWNSGKHETLVRYLVTAMIGIVQAVVAYFTNILSSYFISSKFDLLNDLLEKGHVALAFVLYAMIQLGFAMVAAILVWIEPVAAGSGIPEVKCFLNGIDLPNVGRFHTLICKVLGVICSVSAGLPVGKEGPMVHSGAVVATTLSSGKTRNDLEVRDFVACGAAAGVCTAFSAPIGGILFALEEGASYWGPSLTWRCFFCTMVALTTLYGLNSLGSAFGKIGFNKLFSFGNFLYEGDKSSFAVYELLLFMVIGVAGGMIGAVFNNTNERITHWRIKNVNHSKKRRFIEVACMSLLVSTVTFAMPLIWVKCTPMPENPEQHEIPLLDELVSFRCRAGEEYNELASLFFTEPGVGIRQLFHLHKHAFSDAALFLFFAIYICLAVVVYGIAIPSGLFVPSLLSGAAFGRLFGNLLRKLHPQHLAYSNTYALVGAAAVLGGMARMTISLTVILLECTGNEQYVLPLMLTLMTARLVGGIFNDDLYHIHIHLKKGVQFLEAELKTSSRHHDLVAGQIMGENVIFFRPVEKVSTVVDVLKSCGHSTFPIVNNEDGDILFGTITANVLCALLKSRSFGRPVKTHSEGVLSNHIQVGGETFVPIAGWEVVQDSYPEYPSVRDVRIGTWERELFLDLRPFANRAPVTVQETASVNRTYQVFRSLGLRFLPVVNKRNQVVGTITRRDISPLGLSEAFLTKHSKKVV